VAATKRDLTGPDDRLADLRTEAQRHGLDVVPVSAVSGEGLTTLKRRLLGLLSEPVVLLEGHA